MRKPILLFGLTILYLLTYFAIYILHARYFQVNVVLYSALMDMFLAAVPMSLLLFVPISRTELQSTERVLLVVVWLLMGYSIAISIPTVIDRSLSFYILEKLDQRGGGIRQSAFDEVFKKEYIVEHRLVDIRLTEQLESGTITIQDDCVQLTPKGRVVGRASRWFRKNFLPKHRQILGNYTDALTDPFKVSSDQVGAGYRCQ